MYFHKEKFQKASKRIRLLNNNKYNQIFRKNKS